MVNECQHEPGRYCPECLPDNGETVILDPEEHIIIVFRDCLECGQPIGCLATSDGPPKSCANHQ